MADVTMVVTEITRAVGIVDWTVDANTEDGDAHAGAGDWYFPNDGQTFLLLYADAGAGETLTFTSKVDKFGRDAAVKTFVVATAKTGLVGPFDPGLWNDSTGKVKFALTTGHNSSKLLAVRIANAERNGV
jgi:hypothetical protein